MVSFRALLVSVATIAVAGVVGLPTTPGSLTTKSVDDTCTAQWGQCGGQGWTGSTCCAAGTTCQVSCTFYSQCLP
ncbi:hypothetical protein B0H17DRAFT_1336875 [Mycena rosella]|uniref:CBM1 domain-containing protein n=1 Tax=Mycena rosella TaxID=1033263 RepID=A0AAD7G785_MYCRO|nr:hypothetical protein B0H17DRAFT_1336875 [Mycena rosella]